MPKSPYSQFMIMGRFITALILATSIQVASAQEQKRAAHVPADVVNYIQKTLSADILFYRVAHNPEINGTAVFSNKSNIQPVKILCDSFIPPKAQLVLEIRRWPDSVNFMENYYLVTKKGNNFAFDKPLNLVTGKSPGRDTIKSPKYDSYNKYFPDDDKFLVYTDLKNGVIKYASGNVFQHKFNKSWFTDEVLGLPRIRLAQYGAANPYNIILQDSTVYLLMKKCDFIKNRPGKFIIKANRYQWPFDYWEILYYSNKEGITHDADKRNFYEVKYVRDYRYDSYPNNQNADKPILRKMDDEEVSRLSKFYKQSLYEFGDIDYSVFN